MPHPFHLDHQAIHVRDMEASVRFYAGMLGLAEVENPMGRGSIRWFALGPGVNLHLVGGNTAPRQERGINTHLALSAADFEAIVARLEAAGAAFGELPNRPGRVTQRPDGVRQCFVQDPDGFWIEINNAAARG